jgi:hypothetical protein
VQSKFHSASANCFIAQGPGSGRLTGDKPKVVWAEFSSKLDSLCELNIKGAHIRTANARVENWAQV